MDKVGPLLIALAILHLLGFTGLAVVAALAFRSARRIRNLEVWALTVIDDNGGRPAASQHPPAPADKRTTTRPRDAWER